MGLYVNQNTYHEEDAYEAIAYYRLSKDDGNKQESDCLKMR